MFIFIWQLVVSSLCIASEDRETVETSAYKKVPVQGRLGSPPVVAPLRLRRVATTQDMIDRVMAESRRKAVAEFEAYRTMVEEQARLEYQRQQRERDSFLEIHRSVIAQRIRSEFMIMDPDTLQLRIELVIETELQEMINDGTLVTIESCEAWRREAQSISQRESARSAEASKNRHTTKFPHLGL